MARTKKILRCPRTQAVDALLDIHASEPEMKDDGLHDKDWLYPMMMLLCETFGDEPTDFYNLVDEFVEGNVFSAEMAHNVKSRFEWMGGHFDEWVEEHMPSHGIFEHDFADERPKKLARTQTMHVTTVPLRPAARLVTQPTAFVPVTPVGPQFVQVGDATPITNLLAAFDAETPFVDAPIATSVTEVIDLTLDDDEENA